MLMKTGLNNVLLHTLLIVQDELHETQPFSTLIRNYAETNWSILQCKLLHYRWIPPTCAKMLNNIKCCMVTANNMGRKTLLSVHLNEQVEIFLPCNRHFPNLLCATEYWI